VLWNVPTQEGELFEKGMEDAIGTYSHLQGFRRAVFLVWDNGQVRFFCGWSEAERILGTLGIEGELHLDEMGLNTLSEEDQGRFRKLVSENSHLLEWTAPDRVRMRPWPPNLNMESWQQGIRWFNHLTTASVQHGGVLNTLDLVGHYYRLPSTGLLVKNFYQFDVVLFNQQACARIVWLLAQIISVIEQQGEKVQWIVSVTRPMISLARDLVNNYHLYNRAQAPRFLARSTVEELEESREEIATGPAIILTDVISSGSLCKQIQVALPEVKWLGILALLDTRDITFDESIEEQALQIIPGWEPQKIHDIELGDVYSLSRKRVEKLHPAKVKVKHVIPIDKVNICPAEFPDQRDTRKREIWPFLKYDGKALKIGHYQAENYHHYIYYINALQLLDTTDPNDGESLRQFIAKSVVDDLNKINCDPDKAVLIHPPREVSYAEEIAKEIQRHTGILNRLILYRDSFAGHWRFSPFVQRGVRFGGYTAVLIDDGSNTGETLIGLLDAASFGQPFRILAYICITRMPLHKADLLSRLNGLKGISSEVKVQFMVSFNIPVYSQRTCPICRFRRGLSEVSTASSVFSPFAGAMREETEANKAGSHAGTEDSLSLWKYTTPLGVARLREQIELVDYEAQSALAVDEILKKAAKLPTTVSDDNDSLLDLAFILCTEPDLSESAMFAPYLADLLQHTFARIKACHEDNLMTYVGLAYELMFHLQRRSGSDFQQHLTGFWRAIFGRTQLKVGGLSRVVTFMLARALAERGIESEPHVGLCRVLAKQLLRHVSSRTDRRFEEKNILVWGSGRLFAHEIMATLEGSGHLLGFALDLDHSDLLSVAISAAAKFWRHASIHVTDPISRLANASSYSNDTVRGLTEAAIRELLEGFYKLHQLQHTLCDIERSLSISRGQSPGACLYWGHPNMTSAIDGYGQALIQVAEAVETSTDITDKIENLKEAWQSLQPYLTAAFDDIFPVVSEIFDERWSEWDSISHLPAQAARPLDMARRLDRERVFMPRMLLSRFFTVTMENLKTAAFKAWSKAQIIKEGYARVSILKEQSDGQSIICVRVSDNGSRHSKNSSTFSKHSHKKKTGRGLSDISEMVKSFGGEIKGPCISEQETVIELRMRHVILGRQQRIER
jgi:hypothetical protein